MRINYNVSSIIARNALNNNDMRLSNSIQRLSSGYKINSASDDAAGLAIARRMNAQIKSLQRANRNSNDGLSVVNTADGAMSEMHDILQRMNELAIQSANGTNSDSDRAQIQLEIDELIEELDRIADTTQFNAQNLLDGSFAYKGYTNTENIKVMSYNDSVTSGTYAIGQLTYSYYEDRITSKTGIVEHDERYGVDTIDEIKDALVTTENMQNYAGVSGIKAFPDGCQVSVEDENIIIKAENDFEVKLTLNNRDAVNTGITTTVTTTTSTISNYKNISVSPAGDDTAQYNISSLNIKTDGTDTTYYINSEEEGLSGLETSLAGLFEDLHPNCEISIDEDSFSVDAVNGIITMNYTYTDENNQSVTDTLTLNLYQERDNVGNPTTSYTLDTYLETTTETIETKYTIGGNTADDCIALNLTGMGAMIIQVGANEGQYMELEIPSLNTNHLGVDDLDITTEESATAAIDIVGNAINHLSSVRAKIGAYANRLEHTITNLDTTEENMTASYSRIMDVDMATEMTEYSSVQVLVQASTSMLSQANERPQQVLQLLQ